MSELAVVSGKGGTGKTSIVGSFAALAENKIMVDCDVDAADLRLILNPENTSTQDFVASNKAKIIQGLCTACGICFEYCRFEAIERIEDPEVPFRDSFVVNEYVCEGCGVCDYFCPEKAIDFRDVISGQWYRAETKYGPMLHARLGIAQANSGKLVSLLRKEARQIASENSKDLIIIDGPPGVGCSVIASLTGVDLVLIITEPSVSAFHDMERLVQLTSHFGIKTGICINKYDINSELAERIEKSAGEMGLIYFGRIPFSHNFTKAHIRKTPCVEYADSNISEQIRILWENVKKEIQAITQNKSQSSESLRQLL